MIDTSEHAIQLLTDGGNLSEKCESIACLLENRVFSDDAVHAVSMYKNSETPLMFGITLGELSTAYLDIAGVSPYTGDNQPIISLIETMKKE